MAADEGIAVGWRGEQGARTLVHVPPGTLHRHMLVTGTTGYGKTGFLLSLILGLLSRRARTGIVVVDPKGETVQLLRDQFLPVLCERSAGLAPEQVVTVSPFGGASVRLDPCARVPGLAVEVQAHCAGQLLAGMVDGVGPRMASCLSWLLRAAIEAGGSLLDVRAALVEPEAACAMAHHVREEEVRHYLLATLARESQATREALRARIDHLLLLPQLKAMLCARGSLSGSEMIEAQVTLVDLSGSPLGMEATARFVGGWIFTLLTAAALNRTVREDTHPVLIAIDEWHRIANTGADDLERLLSQVRFKRVALALANQSLGQISSLSMSLLQSLITNVSLQALFRPAPEDLRDLDDLLPVTGRKIDPDLPDRLLSLEDEKRRYKSALSRLPPRQALFVDRVAGKAEVVTTLSLPFEEARRRASMLPASTLEAWARGRAGVPFERLLGEARRTVSLPVEPEVRAEQGAGAARASVEVVAPEAEEAARPAPEPRAAPSRSRAGRTRLRLVVPS